MSKKLSEKSVLIISCLLSYILLTLVSLLRLNIFKSIPDNAIINSGLAVIIGSVIISAVSILIQQEHIKKLFVKLYHKTLNDSIWKDILDLENGSNLKIYLKNKNFYLIGSLKNMEENGNDSWIALKAYSKYKLDTNEQIEPSYLDRDDISVVIRLSDVDYMEVF